MIYMRDKRAIIIKNPRLREVRNNLRLILLSAVTDRLTNLLDERQKLKIGKDGSPSELSQYRDLQKQESQLSMSADKSICKCVACGKADRDMVYNKPYRAWYCTECYNMHRAYAKELFQVIGKTKPQGHEETAIHELYETFLDYQESHEIELKLVREGILIYLLRFHGPSDEPSYATFTEIQNVLGRSQKAIIHVLNSLKHEGLIELKGSSDKLKAWLTQQGKIEAERVLNKVKGMDKEVPIFKRDFPSTLEDFNLLFATHSEMLEYRYPEIFEKIAIDLKSEKASSEKIKRKIDELKNIFDY